MRNTHESSYFTTYLVGVFLLLASLSSQAGLPLTIFGTDNPTIAPMLEKTMPGVVNISTVTRTRMQQNPLFNDPFFRRFFDMPSRPQQRQSQSLGSGVIIDAAKGHIVTNNHVIDHADEIRVTLRDGRGFDAKVIGKDPEADLAVLEIKAEDLVALPIANSEKLRVGDFVVAIGNPFGLGQTVTSGIISAMGRSGLGIEGYEDFIQTDASINPGNSGGALVNFRGELVGINTAIIGPSGGNVGIGFAIPSNMASEIVDQLITFGEVKRGQLGVIIQDLAHELAKAFELKPNQGVVVSQVMSGSPAEKAGLKQGDVIVSINDSPVNKSSELRNLIGLQRIGKKVEISLIRNGDKRNVTAIIEEPKTTKTAGRKLSKALSGAELVNIDGNHPLADKIKGVEIITVERGSPAWRAGLREHDIILSCNRRAVENIDDLKNAIKIAKGTLLNIRRGTSALFIVIQ